MSNLANKSSILSFFESIAEAGRRFRTYLDENPEVVAQFKATLEEIVNWPSRQRAFWAEASKYGWFPSLEAYGNMAEDASQDIEWLNSYMEGLLENSWPKSKSRILVKYPKRRAILEEAFLLHEEGRYIASIPLLLSQCDGVCAEEMNRYLFTEKAMRIERIEHIKEENPSNIMALFLDLLGLDSCVSDSASNKRYLGFGPNRNGILHGSRKHLEYGNKLNSLKAFSLLLFLTESFDSVSIPKLRKSEI